MGPLRFQPILKDYPWGGRLLEDLGRDLGGLALAAESWDVVDHGADQSVVLAGPYAGVTLGELTRLLPDDLLGSSGPRTGGFPLLLKLLDANRPLSVQVHPDDARAAQQSPPDRGKCEAWVILDVQPGAVLYGGLERGVDEAALRAALAAGDLTGCLHIVEPRVGDAVFIPAGTVHSLGAGLLVAELQQSSDTTFRLFDWNRVGVDGRPRPLHVEAAMSVIDWERGPVDVCAPTPLGRGRERLVACDAFRLERWTLEAAAQLHGGGGCALVLVVEGAVTLEGDPLGRPVPRGGSALIPAAAGAVGISPMGRATVLVATPSLAEVS